VFLRAALCAALVLSSGLAAAQDQPRWRSLFGSPDVNTAAPANALFGAATAPAPLAARAIGSYSRGCLSGGVALPVNGPNWQVMRLSRNRNWGHPLLIAYLGRLARDARAIGWPGLLVGDMAQPRGGPMLTGHSSHQIGLDADIWLTPMPNRVLNRTERENMTAVSMLRDPLNVDREVWTPTHTRLIKLASSYPEVKRIFVHPAIKQALCDQAGQDRAWLSKVRPWWGHYYHFHARIACPPGSASCKGQKDVAHDDGCGAELDGWFQRLLEAERKPAEPDKPAKARPLTLADLPNDCRAVLTSGGGVARAAKPQTADKPAGPPPPRLRFGAGREPAPFGLGD
jgi:penicillin-insensitive murein endopeptidase